LGYNQYHNSRIRGKIMELQNVPFTEARAREMVNVSAGFRKMLKNKKAPLQDHIRISTIFLVVL
jgi:hypothetical protein